MSAEEPRRRNDGRRVSPVVARRELLLRFKAARRAAGFPSREAAAKALEWSAKKQALLESNAQPIPVKDLDVILPTFRVPEAEWKDWRQLAETARQQGWWDDYTDDDLSPTAKQYIGLEWGAVRIRAFTGSIMPALLQIPGYTAAALTSGVIDRPPEQVRRLLEVRRQRQRVLGPPDPLTYDVVMDEAALQRPGGDPDTMQAQLLHVIDQVETRPNVNVRVVPFSAGLYPGQSGTFNLMDFDARGDDDPGMVMVEPGFASTLFLEERREVYLHSQVFQHLLEVALSAEESLQRLHTVADENERRHT